MWKNTRSEVMWNNSFMPWRRSPLWLLIRVSLQLLLVHEAASALDATCLFKSLILFFTTSLLAEGIRLNLPSDLIEITRSKVARRKHKLAVIRDQVDNKVFSFAERTMANAAQELISRQSLIIADTTPANKLSCLQSVDFAGDTVHKFKKFDDFINSIADRASSYTDASFNQPSEISAIRAKCAQACSNEHVHFHPEIRSFGESLPPPSGPR